MKKLRIATMVTGHFTTPPPEGIVYAPMDIAVGVAEGLAKKGHRVDFYGPEGTKVNFGRVVSVGLRPLQQNGGDEILKSPDVGGGEVNKIFNLWDQYLIAQMFKEAEKGAYDILHIHPVDRALPMALSHFKIPVVYTLHDPICYWRAEVFKMFSSPNQYYVSISENQRKPAPDLNYIDTIYNGINMELFPFSATHDDYFIFVGRLLETKGVTEAIQAAKIAGVKLLIVGTPSSGEYWDNKIKPFLNDKIQYIGFVPYNELYKYYQKAKAILVPIQWEEPFGLVMTEAMACGTPVIGFRRGSVPEVVEHGKTGFVVDTIEEMVEAISKIDNIKREDCRMRVEEKFSNEKMTEGYEKAFVEIMQKNNQLV